MEEVESVALAVTYSAPAITADFDTLAERVRKVISDYEGAVYDLTDEEDMKGARRDRAYLNGLKKEIEERRKAVKREYTKPLKEFEDGCKAVTALIDDAVAGIKAQIDAAEDARRQAAYAALRQHYEDAAPLLVPVVPYERIHEDQWLNKGFGEMKAYAAIDEKVSRVAQAWDALKTMAGTLPRYDACEREFFRTLDLTGAIQKATEAAAEDARISTLHEDTASLRSRAGRSAEERFAWVVEVPSATRSQMEMLAVTLRQRGIRGTVKRAGE